ncbi:hypothetical protein AAY473_003474 [Plecturocebus cupreus]
MKQIYKAKGRMSMGLNGVSLSHPGWSAVAESWLTATFASWLRVILQPQPLNTSWVETGFHHVGQAGLKPLTSNDLPALASQSTGITGMSHWAQPTAFLMRRGKEKQRHMQRTQTHREDGLMKNPEGQSEAGHVPLHALGILNSSFGALITTVESLLLFPCLLLSEALVIQPPTKLRRELMTLDWEISGDQSVRLPFQVLECQMDECGFIIVHVQGALGGEREQLITCAHVYQWTGEDSKEDGDLGCKASGSLHDHVFLSCEMMILSYKKQIIMLPVKAQRASGRHTFRYIFAAHGPGHSQWRSPTGHQRDPFGWRGFFASVSDRRLLVQSKRD